MKILLRLNKARLTPFYMHFKCMFTWNQHTNFRKFFTNLQFILHHFTCCHFTHSYSLLHPFSLTKFNINAPPVFDEISFFRTHLNICRRSSLCSDWLRRRRRSWCSRCFSRNWSSRDCNCGSACRGIRRNSVCNLVYRLQMKLPIGFECIQDVLAVWVDEVGPRLP